MRNLDFSLAKNDPSLFLACRLCFARQAVASSGLRSLPLLVEGGSDGGCGAVTGA